MQTTSPQLQQLASPGREKVEAWLFEFERSWDDGRLKQWFQHLPPPGSPLRLPALIELVRIDLEQNWRRGRRPKIEAYIRFYPEIGSAETVPAYLIAAECAVRTQRGDKIEPDEVARRFPKQTAEVRRLLAGEDRTEGGPTMNLGASDTSTAGTQPVPPPPPKPEPRPVQFGRYLLLQRIGGGGMGEVHLAEDTDLKRRVALKFPHLDSSARDVRERFLREARAMAALEHRNICPVYDVGEANGKLFLTMKYIDGRRLSDVLRAGLLVPREVADLVRRLAVALQTAHDRDLVHRDLKPSNILVDQDGEPVVVDFGLVRGQESSEDRLTQDGVALGTPAYMAPEQARGEIETIGPAVDVYALGVILYECLTGRVPFEGTALVLINRILTQDPPPPSKRRPGLDRVLEAICLRAMAKEPADRYPSMRDLAAALAAYLEMAPPPQATDPTIDHPAPVIAIRPEPVRMQPVAVVPARYDPTAIQSTPPPLPVLVRPVPSTTPPPLPWTRWPPNRGMMMALAGGAVLAVLLVVGLIVALSGGGQEPRADNGGPGPGEQKGKGGKVPRPPRNVPVLRPLRQFEELHPAALTCLTISANGKRLASADRDRTARVWEVETGKTIRATTFLRPVHAIALGSRGEYALACEGPIREATAAVYRWNLLAKPGEPKAEPELWWPPKDFGSDACHVAISPDGRRALIGEWFGTAILVDTATGKPLREYKVGEAEPGAPKPNPVVPTAFAADNERFLTASLVGRTVQLWRVLDKTPLCVLPPQPLEAGQPNRAEKMTSAQLLAARLVVALAPDATHALVSTRNTYAQIWKLSPNGGPAAEGNWLEGHTAPILCAAFSPDGRLAVTGGRDDTLRLWDVRTGDELRRLVGHAHEVTCATFTPDGQHILSGSGDRTIRVWAVPPEYLNPAPKAAP